MITKRDLITLIMFLVCLLFSLLIGITVFLEKENPRFEFSELISSFAILFAFIGILRQVISVSRKASESSEKVELKLKEKGF